MKWVLMGNRHINTDQVQAFWWDRGQLRLMFENNEVLYIIADPEKKSYYKLCLAVGVRPAEEGPPQ